MFVETGHYALVLALALALVQSVLPMWGAVRRDDTLMGTAVPVSLGQLALIAYSFACLTEAHVASDFSLLNVIENTHSTQPLVYKIASVWGNHEGSMLLWVSILALFGGLVAGFGHGIPQVLRSATLAVQGWIASAFLLFILLTSDPFARVARAPMEGRDLNPILQDPGLAIHPPLLYLGYVGFSIVFSFAAAALITGRVDAGWARFVRPWALLAWIFLTLGIAMGSYWAYYTLGWGGFWFWDPVENASLMPWIAVAARHLPGAIRRADIRAQLRQRPDPRHLHPSDPGGVHRGLTRALCLAGAEPQGRRPVRARVARRRSRLQQPLPVGRMRDGAGRHALPAGT